MSYQTYRIPSRWTAQECQQAAADAAELHREREIAFRRFHRAQTANERLEELMAEFGGRYESDYGWPIVYTIYDADGLAVRRLTVDAGGWTEQDV